MTNIFIRKLKHDITNFKELTPEQIEEIKKMNNSELIDIIFHYNTESQKFVKSMCDLMGQN